jgi:predicted LPLAT superfamily acyltransferase
MKPDPYSILVLSGRVFGSWLFGFVARLIACGYFCSSAKRQAGARFYALLYPRHGWLYHQWCTFKQFQNFTTIHYDRFQVNQGRQPEFISEGLERLQQPAARNGSILLMSHLGNWEMAARLLMRELAGVRLLLYMGVKEKEGVEKRQKSELRKAGVTIVGADQTDGAPFSVVDGIRLLREGGVVSMAGDILWRAEQRSLEVKFLGRKAKIPEAPFVFALVSGAPLYVFFAFRIGNCKYRFTLSEPIFVSASSRAERQQAIISAAQRYVTLLEEALRSHPFEWYHFASFVSAES